jgi:hypothetical protein
LGGRYRPSCRCCSLYNEVSCEFLECRARCTFMVPSMVIARGPKARSVRTNVSLSWTSKPSVTHPASIAPDPKFSGDVSRAASPPFAMPLYTRAWSLHCTLFDRYRKLHIAPGCPSAKYFQSVSVRPCTRQRLMQELCARNISITPGPDENCLCRGVNFADVPQDSPLRLKIDQRATITIGFSAEPSNLAHLQRIPVRYHTVGKARSPQHAVQGVTSDKE